MFFFVVNVRSFHPTITQKFMFFCETISSPFLYDTHIKNVKINKKRAISFNSKSKTFHFHFHQKNKLRLKINNKQSTLNNLIKTKKNLTFSNGTALSQITPIFG